MSVNPNSGSLQIPNITVDDLQDFHNRHFAHATSLKEDSLGYYPDGVKRTLTDDQIAIFRHSEMETLLRERRHLEEATMQDRENKNAGQNSKKSSALIETLQNQVKVPPIQKIQQSSPDVRSGRTQKWTHRRTARAQDEVIAADVDLDYG